MLRDTISQIEAKLQDAPALKGETRAELLKLLATLRSEVASLSQTDAEQARSIAGYAEVSAHEATRERKNEPLLEHSVKGLRASVAGFEKSHPRLVDIVNRIATTLSNLGI
jgi:hypothetical protein